MNRRHCCLLFTALSLLLLSLSHPVRAQEAPEYFYLTLDPPTTLGTNAAWASIDNSDDIVGSFVDAKTGLITAVLYQNGAFTEAPPIPNAASAFSTVNDHGAAVGAYLDQNGLIHGFMRAADGTITYLPDVVAGGNTFAEGINDDGVIVSNYVDTKGVTHGYVAVPVP